MGPNDWRSATPATDDGHATWIQHVAISDTGGTPFDFATVFGSPTDAAWNGTDPSATVISLLKAIAVNTGTP
jgi:hypothetical protein